MNGRHGGVQRCFLGLALVLVVQSARSEPSPFAAINGFEPHFIPPSGSIYIKNIKTDFHAVGDGVTDDTKAFKDAIEADNPRTIYIPAGTYLIREPLRYGEQAGKKKRTLLIGESRATTIIKLADGATGFGNVATPKVFIHTRQSAQQGEQNMHMYLYHLTIEIGKNNPGAIALNFHTNNSGALRDIEVRASDPINHRPLRGIAFDDYWFGPGSARYVTVKGFKQGLFVYNAQNHTTLEHIDIEQCDTGLSVASNVVSARKIHTKECKVAVVNKGFLTMVESSFDAASGDVAVINNGRLVIRAMSTSGYSTALKNGQNAIAGPLVPSFISNGVTSNWTPQPECDEMLGLPVAESPEYQYPQSAQGWTLIPSSSDISTALQDAIDAGKEFIMLDDGSITKTIILRNKVKKIMGAGVRVINYNTGSAPVFRLEGGEAPTVIIELIYENYGSSSGVVFEQAAPRTLVLRHGSGTYRTAAAGSGGSVFLESFVGGPLAFTKVKAWGRDINTELGGANAANIVNDNGQLWLLGQKTEDWATKLKTINGGFTELLGGSFRQNWDGEDFAREGMNLENAPPLFEIVNAHAAFSFATWKGPQNYRVLVRETRGGETRDLIHKDYGGLAEGTHSLYVGYTKYASAQTRFGSLHRASAEGTIKVCQVNSGALPQLAIATGRGSESVALSLYALSGRVVAHQVLAPSPTVQMVPLRGLSAGTYLAVLRQGGAQIGAQTVIISTVAEAKK